VLTSNIAHLLVNKRRLYKKCTVHTISRPTWLFKV